MDRRSEERMARNDAIFRAANERIRDAAEEQEMTELIPFICECVAEDCTQIVQLSLAEYESIRSDPTHFMNAPGHHVAARWAGEVVEQNERYFVVRKTGAAAELAQELDPRSPA